MRLCDNPDALQTVFNPSIGVRYNADDYDRIVKEYRNLEHSFIGVDEKLFEDILAKWCCDISQAKMADFVDDHIHGVMHVIDSDFIRMNFSELLASFTIRYNGSVFVMGPLLFLSDCPWAIILRDVFYDSLCFYVMRQSKWKHEEQKYTTVEMYRDSDLALFTISYFEDDDKEEEEE